jgi:hypothetical protein
VKPARSTNSRSTTRDPIILDPRYLRAVEKLEALPENRSGADKTWVERALRGWRGHYSRAVRVR